MVYEHAGIPGDRVVTLETYPNQPPIVIFHNRGTDFVDVAQGPERAGTIDIIRIPKSNLREAAAALSFTADLLHVPGIPKSVDTQQLRLFDDAGILLPDG
jgi:hypothetical protein